MRSFKIALIILLLGFTIYLCFRNYKLSREVEGLKTFTQTPDTIYLDKSFQPEKKYPEDHSPKRILVYGQSGTSQSSLSDSIVKGAPLISNQDSLVQFTLKKDQLDLSLINKPTQTYSTRQFEIDLNRYQYNWLGGQLSRKKVSSILFSPYVYGRYRPFNFLLDIGTGISVETKKFNYKLGINAFYYPRIKSGIGTDIEFQLTYKF